MFRGRRGRRGFGRGLHLCWSSGFNYTGLSGGRYRGGIGMRDIGFVNGFGRMRGFGRGMGRCEVWFVDEGQFADWPRFGRRFMLNSWGYSNNIIRSNMFPNIEEVDTKNVKTDDLVINSFKFSGHNKDNQDSLVNRTPEEIAKEIIKNAVVGSSNPGDFLMPIYHNGRVVGYLWQRVPLSNVKIGDVHIINGEKRVALIYNNKIVGYIKIN